MHLYRAYPVNTHGIILARHDVLCESDHEAVAFASWMVVTGLPAEVWLEHRIIRTASGGHEWGVCFEQDPAKSPH